MSLIPAPWSLALKIGLPILAIGGAYFAGDIHGNHEGADRTAGKYQPAMDRAKSAIDLTAARIRAARAEALAKDLAKARAQEAIYARAHQETENALIPALDAARADAARQSAKLRALAVAAQTAGNNSIEPRLPYETGPASDPDATSETAIMDADTLTCAVNTVAAEQWQAFWRKAFPGAPK